VKQIFSLLCSGVLIPPPPLVGFRIFPGLNSPGFPETPLLLSKARDSFFSSVSLSLARSQVLQIPVVILWQFIFFMKPLLSSFFKVFLSAACAFSPFSPFFHLTLFKHVFILFTVFPLSFFPPPDLNFRNLAERLCTERKVFSSAGSPDTYLAPIRPGFSFFISAIAFEAPDVHPFLGLERRGSYLRNMFSQPVFAHLFSYLPGIFVMRPEYPFPR